MIGSLHGGKSGKIDLLVNSMETRVRETESSGRTNTVGGEEISGAPKRPKDQRTEVVKLDFCACEAPELVAKIEGTEYPAQPSDSFGAAAALYLAQCQVCGGAYKLPWRRSVPTGEPDGTAAPG